MRIGCLFSSPAQKFMIHQLLLYHQLLFDDTAQFYETFVCIIKLCLSLNLESGSVAPAAPLTLDTAELFQGI